MKMLLAVLFVLLAADSLPIVSDIEPEPLAHHVSRLIETAEYLGVPFAEKTRSRLEAAVASRDPSRLSVSVQRALDPLCLAAVMIREDGAIEATPGSIATVLHEQGWTQYLVKVHNEAEARHALQVHSPSANPLAGSAREAIRGQWLEVKVFDGRPMSPRLRGAKLEYQFIQLYSRDPGKRGASFSFYLDRTGQGGEKFQARSHLDWQPCCPHRALGS